MIEIPAGDKEQILSGIDTAPRRNGPTLASLKMQRIKLLFKEGDISREEYLADKAQIQAEMARVSPPTSPDLTRAADILTDLGRVWSEATSERTQKVLLRGVFEAIFFDGAMIPD